MTYAMYKDSRNAALQCLLDNNIRDLPIKVSFIAANNGIKILKDSTVKVLSPSQSGVAICQSELWYIIYADDEPIPRARFTIAHELGHIFLGHDLTSAGKYRIFARDLPEPEREAELFAALLLMPACVLWGLNVHTPDEIMELCVVSRAAAEHRAKRMEELYRHGAFLTSPLEEKVYNNFENRIKNNKTC